MFIFFWNFQDLNKLKVSDCGGAQVGTWKWLGDLEFAGITTFS